MNGLQYRQGNYFLIFNTFYKHCNVLTKRERDEYVYLNELLKTILCSCVREREQKRERYHVCVDIYFTLCVCVFERSKVCESQHMQVCLNVRNKECKWIPKWVTESVSWWMGGWVRRGWGKSDGVYLWNEWRRILMCDCVRARLCLCILLCPIYFYSLLILLQHGIEHLQENRMTHIKGRKPRVGGEKERGRDVNK